MCEKVVNLTVVQENGKWITLRYCVIPTRLGKLRSTEFESVMFCQRQDILSTAGESARRYSNFWKQSAIIWRRWIHTPAWRAGRSQGSSDQDTSGASHWVFRKTLVQDMRDTWDILVLTQSGSIFKRLFTRATCGVIGETKSLCSIGQGVQSPATLPLSSQKSAQEKLLHKSTRGHVLDAPSYTFLNTFGLWINSGLYSNLK